MNIVADFQFYLVIRECFYFGIDRIGMINIKPAFIVPLRGVNIRYKLGCLTAYLYGCGFLKYRIVFCTVFCKIRQL